MAGFSVNGLDDLILSMEEVAGMPDDVQNDMLNAQADIVLKAQKAEAEKLGMYSGYNTHNNSRDTSATNTLSGQSRSHSTGGLARSLKKSSPKKTSAGRSVKIYFAGSRSRGNTTTTNTEIAFLNEFGTRNINARRFIWTANEKSAQAAVDASAQVYNEWLKSKNL